MKIEDKYSVSVEKIDHGKNYWKTMKVSIFQHEQGQRKKKIGEYNRNYSSLYDTFFPFRQRKPDGTIKEYALISDKYVRTAVMELPSCKIIAEEPVNSYGFCPTGFFVPNADQEDDEDGLNGQFGFVSGCVWGDDSSWKVQYLDLSEIDKGKIKRDDRFGYVELPDKVKLKDAIGTRNYFVGELDFTNWNTKLKAEGKEPRHPDKFFENDPYIQIAVPMEFDCNTGKLYNAWSVIEILRDQGYTVTEPTEEE